MTQGAGLDHLFQIPWSQLIECGQNVANFWKANAPTAICRGIFGGAKRNRTAVPGFADLCLTARPSHRKGLQI